MKEIIVRRAGRAEPVEGPGIEARPVRGGRIRIRVKYAGVGYADAMAVRGKYLLAPPRPFSPGYEFLGTVESPGAVRGEGARGLRAGERVAGVIPRMGAYREFIDADPRLIVPVPDAVDDETAALLPLNYLTARALIERYAGLGAGRSFLIRGAAGGVGTAALELARIAGLKAYGTAAPGKRDLVEGLGGVWLSREDAAITAGLGRLEPGGVDAAFDAFGAASFAESWAALKRGGVLVCYGLAPSVDSGKIDSLKSLAFIARRALAGGGKRIALCSLPAIAATDAGWIARSLSAILESAARGDFRPALGGVYPWNRVGEAHGALESGRVRGKLLLDFSK